MYIFVTFSWFFAFSRTQACFHWFSNPIRSVVMTDHTFCAKILAPAVSRGIQEVNRSSSCSYIVILYAGQQSCWQLLMEAFQILSQQRMASISYVRPSFQVIKANRAQKKTQSSLNERCFKCRGLSGTDWTFLQWLHDCPYLRRKKVPTDPGRGGPW